jgi:hypothetical protein
VTLVALIAGIVVSLIWGALMSVAMIGGWTARRRRMLSTILAAVAVVVPMLAVVVAMLGKCRHSHNQKCR